ncbi:MAG: hypothetical protein LBM65_06205 [Oscillospiraceae bacterium]|nr:hypothetical protein [Oscillospiraceae bacterium]
MTINVVGGKLPQEEVSQYIEAFKESHPDKYFTSFTFKVDGDFLDVDYTYDAVPFERIRRITGYLVGTVDRFNNAKRAEVEDRAKHDVALDNCCALENIA